MQIPMVQAMLPPVKVGVITISKNTLTDAHLLAAGVGVRRQFPLSEPTADGSSRQAFSTTTEIDFAACREDMITAKDLVDNHEGIGAIVLNAPTWCPMRRTFEKDGLPVFSIYISRSGSISRCPDGSISCRRSPDLTFALITPRHS